MLRQYVIRGQDLEEEHGIQGLAFDGDGLLYALDRAAKSRVVVLDPRTGRQRNYATFRDVPPCGPAGPNGQCEDTTVTDASAEPDYAVFGPGGALYVTDIEQALIWRVPRGGGRARVWFTDSRFETPFGLNGAQFRGDGRTLVFAASSHSPEAGDPTSGAIYELPVRANGRPGKLRQLWRSRPLDGPDGFAIGRSGRIYLALAVANQLVVISRQGEELARIPATPLENGQQEIPFDGPGSVAFLGRRALVSNHSFMFGNPQSWAILDVFAGETGLPLFRPRVVASSASDR